MPESKPLTLLPCPFCGETPDLDDHISFDCDIKWGSVVCGCGAAGPDVRTAYKPWTEWRDNAITAWNERKPTSLLSERAEEPPPWQPIETVPVDKYVLLAGWDSVDRTWVVGEGIFLSSKISPSIEGGFLAPCNNTNGDGDTVIPTYWRPLPAPPGETPAPSGAASPHKGPGEKG